MPGPSDATMTMLVCPSCGQRLRLPRSRLAERPRCPACKSSVFGGQPIELNDQSFDRFVAATDLPVLVDFWAAWCGPCRSVAPVIARAASSLEPQIFVAKTDVDASPSTAAKLKIRSIPTLILFKGGKEHARISGALSDDALQQWLESVSAFRAGAATV